MHDAQDYSPQGGTITDEIVDRIAAVADADRRSVIRRLAGLPLRGRVQRRVDAAIAAQRGSRTP